MKLLLDTNIFIKVLANSHDLSDMYRLYISDKANEKWISQFSIMELAIKIKIGKLRDIQISLEELLKQAMTDGFLHLPVVINMFLIIKIFLYLKIIVIHLTGLLYRRQ